jgi:hypothetical protein
MPDPLFLGVQTALRASLAKHKTRGIRQGEGPFMALFVIYPDNWHKAQAPVFYVLKVFFLSRVLLSKPEWLTGHAIIIYYRYPHRQFSV